ncbi:MAG: GtrA family protein [Ruminococcaceae bacterium]|nr:GtrA family protein [Oscillospiraceae bacterium]
MGKMKNKELLRSLKFLLFSISAGIVQLISFTLLNEVAGLKEWLSYLIALCLSVLWNFTFNRKFTFRSAGNVPKAMCLAALFYVVFAPASTWLESYLAGIGWNEYLVTLVNMVLNLVLEFPYQKYVVFRNSIDTNELAKK